MTDLFSSPTFPRHSSPFRDEMSNMGGGDMYQRSKRSRHENDEYIAEYDEECELEDHVEPSSLFHLEKRARQGSSSFSARNRSIFHVERTTASLESELENMREEYRLKFERQEVRLREAHAENVELAGANEGLKSDNQKLVDENRILKRAVGIQESRFKDSSAQNSQLREYLGQAADQIAKLERGTSLLRMQLHRANTPNSFLDDMPPDVY